MAEATTSIIITAKDSTAGAFASVNNNLTGLGRSAAATIASIAGIGLSLNGIVSGIRGVRDATIQLQQFTNTLQVGTGSARGAADALAFVRTESQRLGLDLATAADQFGKLTAASKGTVLEGKATRDIFTSVSQAATALGLSADQTSGSLLAIQQIISKGTVSAEELRGQLGERLPGAFQIAARAIGVTTAELDKLLRTGSITAGQLLPALSRELDKTFGAQSEQAAQGLTAQMNRMNTAIFDLKIAIGESGLIDFLSSGIELSTKLANALTNAFGGGQKLNPVEKQIALIQKLQDELTHIQGLNSIIPVGDFLFSKKDQDELKFRIESATEDLQKMKAAITVSGDDSKVTVPAKVAIDSKAAGNALRDLNKAQDAALRRESEYIKLLTIERQARDDLIRPYANAAKSAQERLEAMRQEQQALALSKSRQISLEEAIELTTIARLEEKRVIEKDSGIVDQISKEIAARKEMVSIIGSRETKQSGDKIRREELTAYDQFSIQAARNIQTNLAFGIEQGFRNGFKSGIKGLLDGIASTASQIISQILAQKLLQSSGIGGALGMAGGSGALNLASLGTNAFSVARGGFGSLGVLSSAGRGLPGVAGQFFGGLGGVGSASASAGIFSSAGGAGTAFIGGPGTALGGAGMGGAASMGASFASVAGPAIALAAVDAIGRALAGDKKLGGAEMIPVIGGFMAALFGRGPMKFRQQSLQGTVSDDGFDGDITNVFRAKGGFLVGNKHKPVTEQLSSDMQLTLDTTLQGFYQSTRAFADNLGFSTDLVDNFTKEVQIKSEKGKTITQEAVAEMLSGISNEIAKNVLPIVDTYRKIGEDSFATLGRLSAEFTGLERSAENLGASVAYANELIKSMSIDARTAFIDQAGGVEALQESTQFFYDAFLTQSEKVALMSDKLNGELEKLGLSASLTANDFKGLVQSVDTSNELRISLLKLAPAFVAVRDAAEAARISAQEQAKSNLGGAFSDLQKSVETERKRITDEYNKSLQLVSERIADVTDNVQKLSTLNNALKSTLSTLNPLSLSEARAQIQGAIASSQSGNIVELNTISEALNKLSEKDTSGFSTRNDFLRSQATSTNLVTTLDKSVSKQLTLEERSLNALIANRDRLESGFNAQMIRLDQLVSTAQAEINAINGLNGAIMSLVAAIGNFNSATVAAGGTPVTPPTGTVRGNSRITSKDIVNFANANAPIDTYRAAIRYGVSSDQIVASGKYTRDEIDKFVRDNNLASFDVGGIVPKTGLALVHKNEQIINPQQKDNIIATLERVITAINRSTGASSDTYKLLRNMTDDGLSLKTTAAA